MDNSNSQSFWWGVAAFILTPILIIWGKNYTPDEFDLNDNTVSRQHVWNMSALDNVERIQPDAMSMKENSTVAIAYPGTTQFASEYTTTLSGGEGIRFRFRTTRHDYKQDKNTGLSFSYTPTGCTLEENGRTVQYIDSIRATANTPTRILIQNHGNYYSITVGCSRIVYKTTSLPSTEYVIVETMGGTAATMKDITFASTMEE